MEAVLQLCTHGLFLESGCVRTQGDVTKVVLDYLHSQPSSPRVIDLSSRTRPHQHTERARLATAFPSDAGSSWAIPFGQDLSLDLLIDAQPTVTQIDVAVGLYSIRGFEVASWSNKCSDVELPVHPGINTFRIRFSESPSAPRSLLSRDCTRLEFEVLRTTFPKPCNSKSFTVLRLQILMRIKWVARLSRPHRF